MNIFYDFKEFQKVKSCNIFRILLIPEFWGVINYRVRYKINKIKKPIISYLIRFIYWFIDLIITTITGLQISPGAVIGEGLYIPHRGTIVVNGNSKIGKHCTIFHEVTIGRGGARDLFRGSACIGDYVYIGAGAKILGEVNVGNYVTIGANAVITKDIPSFCLVVGNPSKIIFPPSKWENGMKSSFFLLEGWRGGTNKLITLFKVEALKIVISSDRSNSIQVYIDSIFTGTINNDYTTFDIPSTVDLSKPVLIRLCSSAEFRVFSLELI